MIHINIGGWFVHPALFPLKPVGDALKCSSKPAFSEKYFHPPSEKIRTPNISLILFSVLGSNPHFGNIGRLYFGAGFLMFIWIMGKNTCRVFFVERVGSNEDTA
jgi:hypothetical protein